MTYVFHYVLIHLITFCYMKFSYHIINVCIVICGGLNKQTTKMNLNTLEENFKQKILGKHVLTKKNNDWRRKRHTSCLNSQQLKWLQLLHRPVRRAHLVHTSSPSTYYYEIHDQHYHNVFHYNTYPQEEHVLQ